MPRIKTKPEQTTKNKNTTISPGKFSEMRSFCYEWKEEDYEEVT